MTGVVLCGGESRRMGTDKGLITTTGKSWAQIAFDKLTELSDQTVISVNESQVQGYSLVFKSEILIKDDTRLQVKGPLCGLMSVHANFHAEDLFVLACDMVEMKIFLLEELVRNFHSNSNKDCYVFYVDDEPQPLAGIYTARCLKRIAAMIENDTLGKYSMKHVLDISDVTAIDAKEEWVPFFNNYNLKDDIDKQTP